MGIYKYYSFNVHLHGHVVGSRIIRVYIFRSPLYAMDLSMGLISEDKAIADFKRIK